MVPLENTKIKKKIVNEKILKIINTHAISVMLKVKTKTH